MKKLSINLIFIFFFSLVGQCQTTAIQHLNLDFEKNEKGFPTQWDNFGSEAYKIYLDSLQVKSGKFSAIIENTENISDYKALSISLPANYEGDTISLSGYIKTDKVTDGYAGIWMRIDPQIAINNMGDKGVTGTTDWKKYEISLPLNPEKTDSIVVGGLLVGKGKMWLDNLKVSIDGKDLDNKDLKVYKRKIFPAEKDKEFDNGSNIALPNLNTEVINNLALLGRIWGFLKYHHPEIASGNYNWDYELFRVLPEFLDAENNKERDKVLENWIVKYGELSACKNCSPTPNDAVIEPNLFWINDSNLSDKLKASLQEIYDNRNQGENYYIELYPNVSNPDFTNEKKYATIPYPDGGFRLLSLFRYWNIIEYFYPNKHLTDKKWNTVLSDYIPKFINAKNELGYELAALQLIEEVNDTHANLWQGGDKISELRGNNFAPFRGKFIENKFVLTDYYNPEFSEKNKLKIGDIITHIDGRSVETIIDSVKAYYPSSNEAVMLRDVSRDLLRSPQKSINLKYISENQTRENEIKLYERDKLNMNAVNKPEEDEKSYKMLNGNIGYITLENIKQQDIAEIKEYFIDTEGIIIDIRNYPSTFVPFALGSYFVSDSTDFVKFTKGNINNPGEFTFMEGAKIPSDNNEYKGELVVLVNEESQSQAEYTAMAFRAVKNSTIVGSTTAGADGNVSTIFLPGGLRTIISGIGVYYPDGTETQRVGIVPDIIVKPTIEGIKKGKDEVLEKAIQIINQ